MKRILLFLFILCFANAANAQDKLNFVNRYCLLPFVEGSLGGVHMNVPQFYGKTATKFSAGGASIQIGFAKQLADLKLSASIGYSSVSNTAVMNGAKDVMDQQTVNYFEANSVSLPNFVQDSLYSWNKYYTQLAYAQLNLRVEKRFANWYTIGAGLSNNFVVRYLDEQKTNYNRIINGQQQGNFETIALKKEVRGINTYQLVSTVFVGRQIRRPKLKMDWGLNSSISINSMTRTEPASSFLLYYGVYTRFYFIPNVY